MTTKEKNNIRHIIIPYIVQGIKNWALRDSFKHNTWTDSGIKKRWTVLCTCCYTIITSRIFHVMEMVHLSWMSRAIKAHSYREISWVTSFTGQGYFMKKSVILKLVFRYCVLDWTDSGSGLVGGFCSGRGESSRHKRAPWIAFPPDMIEATGYN